MASVWQVVPQRTKQNPSMFREILYRKASDLEYDLQDYLQWASSKSSDKWVSIAATEHRLPPPTPDEVWALNDDPRWHALVQHSIQQEQEDWDENFDEYMAALSDTSTTDDHQPVPGNPSPSHPTPACRIISVASVPRHPGPVSNCRCEPCILNRLWNEDRRKTTPTPPVHVPQFRSGRAPDLRYGVRGRFDRVKTFMANTVHTIEVSQQKKCLMGSRCDPGRCSGYLLAALGSPPACHHAMSIARVLRFAYYERQGTTKQDFLVHRECSDLRDSDLLWVQRLLNQVQSFQSLHKAFRNRCHRRQASIRLEAFRNRQSRTRFGPWKPTPGPSRLRQVTSINDEWPDYTEWHEYIEWPEIPVAQATSSVAASQASTITDILSSWHAGPIDEEGEDDDEYTGGDGNEDEDDEDDEDELEGFSVWRQRRNAIDYGVVGREEADDKKQVYQPDHTSETSDGSPDCQHLDGAQTPLGYVNSNGAIATSSTALPSVSSTTTTALPSLRPPRPGKTVVSSVETAPRSPNSHAMKQSKSSVEGLNVHFSMPDYRERITPPEDEDGDDRPMSPHSQPLKQGDSSLDYLDIDKIVRSSKPPSPPADNNQAPVAETTPLSADEFKTENQGSPSNNTHMPPSDLSSADLMLHLVQALETPGSPNKRDHDDYGEDFGPGREKAPRLSKNQRTKLPDRPRK